MGQSNNSNNLLSHRILLLLSLTTFASLVLICRPANCQQDEPAASIRDETIAEARQFFKLNLESNQPTRQRFSRANFKRRRETGNNETSSVTSSSSTEPSAKRKITNLALKKLLLNQSMLRAANGTTLAGNSPGKSTFKFVFIQRASSKPNVTTTSVQADQSIKTKSPASSLAASVSKQLANSLLNTAANIVANMTAPSLSSLASQIAVQKTSTTSSSTTSTTTEPSNSISDDLSPQSSSDDIKRVQAASTKTASVKTRVLGRRPSKIYNLPVKFVSNGQPNGLMFSTIKQHFATIKKLQMAASGSGTKLNPNYNYGHKQASSSSSVNRRKSKPKGQKGNSRLIYLPLKYLSNAKPISVNKILTRATHKSMEASN